MKRFERTRIWLKQNGFVWTVCYLVRVALNEMQTGLDRRLARIEKVKGVPGSNPVALNYAKWEHHDWSKEGEEWTFSEEWKAGLIEDVLHRYVEPGMTVLEIGPGAGRWTEALQPRAEKLILADLSHRCIELCQQRFAGCANMEYHVTDGSSLEFVKDASVDRIWSFDVFVHISPSDTRKYVQEFGRILKPGGRGVIHHHRLGGALHGFRSRMTDELFREMAEEAGLRVVRQFRSWGPNGEYNVDEHGDVISVFEKPA